MVIPLRGFSLCCYNQYQQLSSLSVPPLSKLYDRERSRTHIQNKSHLLDVTIQHPALNYLLKCGNILLKLRLLLRVQYSLVEGTGKRSVTLCAGIYFLLYLLLLAAVFFTVEIGWNERTRIIHAVTPTFTARDVYLHVLVIKVYLFAGILIKE